MSSVLANRLRGLGRLSARLGVQATGLPGLLSWWGQALAAWLPPRLRPVLGVDRGRLLLQRVGDGVRLQMQRGDDLHDFGVLPLAAQGDGDPLAGVLRPAAADLPRWLLLPASGSLYRRVQLPAAAADRLRDVMRFEIDRQTPFTADAVLFDARLRGRRGDGQLDVELVAAPRAAVEPVLQALGPLAGRLAGIDIADAQGQPRGVNLLDPAARRGQQDSWRLWNRVLAFVALGAVIGALALVLANRSAAADALEQQVRERSRPARMAAEQRRTLTALVEGQAFLDRQRAEVPTAVEVLDELTRRLPDGTYLEKVGIEDRRLTLIGLSNQAASLVTGLQDSNLWHSPALSGALQPDPATGRDRFTITAELGRAGAPAAAERAR